MKQTPDIWFEWNVDWRFWVVGFMIEPGIFSLCIGPVCAGVFWA